jgi:hypothetical protein
MTDVDASAMTDSHLTAAHSRACLALSKALSLKGEDTPAERKAFQRWEALDREMTRRKLPRKL